jgi:hypothetical protein
MNLLVYWLFGAHLLADYVMQTKRMAETKHEDLLYLLTHCLVYTAVIIVSCVAYDAVYNGAPTAALLPSMVSLLLSTSFGIPLLLSHLVIDYASSNLSVKWNTTPKNKAIVKGVDQMLHYMVLILIFGALLCEVCETCESVDYCGGQKVSSPNECYHYYCPTSTNHFCIPESYDDSEFYTCGCSHGFPV